MSEFISEEERERMEQFANTPLYARSPEQLVPDEDGT
jgi:hypothetical protein